MHRTAPNPRPHRGGLLPDSGAILSLITQRGVRRREAAVTVVTTLLLVLVLAMEMLLAPGDGTVGAADTQRSGAANVAEEHTDAPVRTTGPVRRPPSAETREQGPPRPRSR